MTMTKVAKNNPALLLKLGLCVIGAIAAVPILGVITTPMNLTWQAYNAIGMILAALIMSRMGASRWKMVLLLLSTVASSRYMYWRITETLPIGAEYSAMDLILASGLLVAEIYAYIILVLGFIQTIWPLQRRPVPLPLDYRTWPTVDVFIPTYNEPLDVVRSTIIAAQDIDWPRDKIKVHVLDDGRRAEYQAFCKTQGVEYHVRDNNDHAKAGNINTALTKTSGEFIAVFDCDHVPTRSFLQMTMGIMVANPRMSLVQTPHHFFSPDPFERNLKTHGQVPNEGELFYGLVQDGNDFWNAAFFCGSCAVIRREALEDIGGIAIETVTEDAHTSLRMHAKGWESAYVKIPQAAGLATERLSAHVGQRIRWARGMAQIFRTDNPMLKKGLSLGQRLCYTNAMLHFFYGLPRVIFLTSPLAYLMLGAEIINAQGWMVLAYAAPHLVIATLTNSTLQGRYRQSFWSEIYETVLATYILLPTLLALISPKLGKFNVTDKGGRIEKTYFDHSIAKPYMVLFALNLIGFAVGCFRAIGNDGVVFDTLVLNMAWCTYNLIILGATIAVAQEQTQIRNSVRVETKVRGLIRQQGRRVYHRLETLDLSAGGALLSVQQNDVFTDVDQVEILLDARQPTWIPAVVLRKFGDNRLALRFENLNAEQERALVSAQYGRANSWLDDDERANRRDRILLALRNITRISARGFTILLGWIAQRVVPRRATNTQPAPEAAQKNLLTA